MIRTWTVPGVDSSLPFLVTVTWITTLATGPKSAGTGISKGVFLSGAVVCGLVCGEELKFHFIYQNLT